MKKKTAHLKRKLSKLLDIYLAEEIGREEYTAMKRRYEAELEKYSALQKSLQTSDSEEKLAKAFQIAEALAAGDEDDADFYLSLVEHIEIINNKAFDIYLGKSAGKWSVEIS